MRVRASSFDDEEGSGSISSESDRDDFGAVFSADLERDRLLVEAVMRRAALARADPKRGFEFAMREEHGERRRVTTLPHQRVALDFLAAFPRANLRAFVGSSKTTLLAFVILTVLGEDPTARGAIVSATQEQAKKPLKLISQMVENVEEAFPELALMYPRLRPSQRRGEPWTQTEITVDRPPGIRDASLVAVGMDGGSLPGSRLKFVLLDDVLNEANTRTPELRKKTLSFLLSTVFTREDIRDTRIWNATQPWHPEDVTYVLQGREAKAAEGEERKASGAGWPTLEMDVRGDVGIWNAPGFDTDDIRPAMRREGPYHRLTAHDSEAHGAPLTIAYSDGTRELAANASRRAIDAALAGNGRAGSPRLEHFDLDETVPLWPEKFGLSEIAALKQKFSAIPGKFAQAYECNPRDDEQAACKQAWVDACKANAIAPGYRRMVSRYDGTNLTVTGVDLAIGKKSTSHRTSLFTHELLPSGKKKLLNIQVGRWTGREIVTRIRDTERDFKSIVRVESNACFPADTLVLTRDGYRPISAIAPGVLVLTHRGRWRPVLDVRRGEARHLVEARAAGGVSVWASMNHWFLFRAAGRTPGRGGGHSRPVGPPTWVSLGVLDRDAYVCFPVPRWDETRAAIRAGAADVPVDEDLALLLGLYMAEGHSTATQVSFTLSAGESHLFDFIVRTMKSRLGKEHVGCSRPSPGAARAVVSSRALARVFSEFGKRSSKCPPMRWMGWPLDVRLAIVRGWLLGDGCVLTNGGGHGFFSGSTISRDWLLFARTTLFQAGYRPSIARESGRRTSVIEGRTVSRLPIYSLCLSTQESTRLRATMTTPVENAHWRSLARDRTARCRIVNEGDRVWSRLDRRRIEPERWKEGPFDVFNLVVEDDQSFVVEDMAVHNAQDYLRQWAIDAEDLQRGREQPASLPLIRAHYTGANKGDPTYGIQGVFIVFENAGWVIPCEPDGSVQPEVLMWLEDCLYFRPGAHTGDVLMSCWLACEQEREITRGRGRQEEGERQEESLTAGLMSR